MNYLSQEETTRLYEAAISASEHAYAPYSGFPVGAAVLTGDGNMFPGTNVENASFGLTICAERIAIGNMMSAGYSDVRAIAVYSGTTAAPPCGACRQFIIEFGENVIVVFRQGEQLVQKTIAELLPFAFTKAMLPS